MIKIPTPPWRILTVLSRAETGPLILEKEFDRKILIPNLQRVIKEYDIKYDPENPVPSDDSLAKDVWRAAVDLFLSAGVYCTTTQRRILFSEDELKEALWCYRGVLEIGEGHERRTWTPRKVEDTKLPGCLFTPVGVRASEETFTRMIMAYIQEPLADAVSTPILDVVEGNYVKPGSPFEIQGGVVHVMLAREAALRVGRPGIAIVLTGTALLAGAQIATSNPMWGARPTDLRLVSLISELKVDYDLLSKALHFRQYNGISGALLGPLYGVYAKAEGTAIIGVASHLAGLMVNQSDFTCYFPVHYKYFNNTSREMLWVVSTTYQALANNTNLISGSNGFAVAGPCTDMVLYEAGLHGMVSAVSGASILWEIASASNKHFERTTPLEARMACETGVAAVLSKLKRSDVNEIVKKILPKYENRIPNAPLGKTFAECYDIKTLTLSKECSELYKSIKREFEEFGIKYPF
ncbi:MAG: monomethylamine:corrinoid methyltransferase [Saccharolobus sp.]|uniref:monomethylamine:corrinoid methyltransferase n=1 Tax=Saccharolobus sp. TaxID=2100761 RepID=UPI0031644CF4